MNKKQGSLDLVAQQNRNLRWANDDLRKQLFEASQQSHRLARKFGFHDVAEAEKAIAVRPRNSDPSTVDATATDNRVQELQAKLDAKIVAVERLESMHEGVVDKLVATRRENDELKAELKKAKGRACTHKQRPMRTGETQLRCVDMVSNKENCDVPASSLANTRPPLKSSINPDPQLVHLQNQYNALLDVKERAAARYKSDYRKWKEFKSWLVREIAHDSDVLAALEPDRQDEYRTAQLAKKRKQFEETGPNVDPLEESDPNITELATIRASKCEHPDNVDTPRERKGRYAQSATTSPTTINSRYEINSVQNGGLDFSYDSVVRNKAERRHLAADDCECCREYYSAVGPLPKRTHNPRWCSPSPHASSPSSHEDHSTSHSVEAHKQFVSRHRHQWARAPTPPGYWDIGFPDTQEVSAINERAGDLHRRQQEQIEDEARRGDGAYKRRRIVSGGS